MPAQLRQKINQGYEAIDKHIHKAKDRPAHSISIIIVIVIITFLIVRSGDNCTPADLELNINLPSKSI